MVQSRNKSSSYPEVDLLHSNQQTKQNPRRLGEDASASRPQTKTRHPNLNELVIQQETPE